MSVRVPRAPRAHEAPDALARMRALRQRTLLSEGTAREREPLSFGPAICVFSGTGILLLAVAAVIEFSPQSPLALLFVALCARLPFGG